MLSKSEWMHEADIASAHMYGQRRARWFAFRHFAAVPTGIALLAGVLGFGGYWVWTRVIGPLFSGGHLAGHIPSAFWPVVIGALFVTALAFRRRIIPPSGLFVILRGIVTALLWLGLAAYAIASLA